MFTIVLMWVFIIGTLYWVFFLGRILILDFLGTFVAPIYYGLLWGSWKEKLLAVLAVALVVGYFFLPF